MAKRITILIIILFVVCSLLAFGFIYGYKIHLIRQGLQENGVIIVEDSLNQLEPDAFVFSQEKDIKYAKKAYGIDKIQMKNFNQNPENYRYYKIAIQIKNNTPYTYQTYEVFTASPSEDVFINKDGMGVGPIQVGPNKTGSTYAPILIKTGGKTEEEIKELLSSIQLKIKVKFNEVPFWKFYVTASVPDESYIQF